MGSGPPQTGYEWVCWTAELVSLSGRVVSTSHVPMRIGLTGALSFPRIVQAKSGAHGGAQQTDFHAPRESEPKEKLGFDAVPAP